MTRKEFTHNTRVKVRWKSNNTCCVCRNEPLWILHHIYSNEDNSIENCAPLCETCHIKWCNDPTRKKRIKEMRDDWYKRVENYCSRFNIDTERLDNFQRILQIHSGKYDIIKDTDFLQTENDNQSNESIENLQLTMEETFKIKDELIKHNIFEEEYDHKKKDFIININKKFHKLFMDELYKSIILFINHCDIEYEPITPFFLAFLNSLASAMKRKIDEKELAVAFRITTLLLGKVWDCKDENDFTKEYNKRMKLASLEDEENRLWKEFEKKR